MLREIIEKDWKIKDIMASADRGEISIDIKTMQVLNSANLPNPHYNKDFLTLITEMSDIFSKHPIKAMLSTALYCIDKPNDAYHFFRYNARLLKGLDKDN
jgi:hypothetical protein